MFLEFDEHLEHQWAGRPGSARASVSPLCADESDDLERVRLILVYFRDVCPWTRAAEINDSVFLEYVWSMFGASLAQLRVILGYASSSTGEACPST